VILHLINRTDWEAAQQSGVVRPASLASEGFVHCSTEHQMVGVANKYYTGATNMLLLRINTALLTPPMKWEPPAHIDGTPPKPNEPLFPHIYGPINVNAVSEVIDFPCSPDGTFAAPPQLRTFNVRNIAQTPQHWNQAAQWGFAAWAHEFPNDTVQTYLDLYSHSAGTSGRLAETFVAIDMDDNLLGCVSLVDDDELPGATEPGPWVAALFVHPSAREHGVGNALLQHLNARAVELGFKQLFLYTEDKQSWYVQKGWHYVRNTVLNQLPHVVMQRQLNQ
jgi:uncharacterized protein (DUF952 family)/N-acetylglutamate synthase-like GNAT family acetyltransferase